MEAECSVSLVIFTCEGREFLLARTLASFQKACNFSFEKIILSIDGQVTPEIIEVVKPDVLIQSPQRKGYVNNIMNALLVVDTPYFFWLEDDWSFNAPVDLNYFLQRLVANPAWVEVFLSKHGPLNAELKQIHIADKLYQSNEFSANPCLCNAKHIKYAFNVIATAPKGNTLGTDGFENSLTVTYQANHLICVIADPVDHTPISHEGYLESTPRNWHMTSSLEKKNDKHLLTIPSPSIVRKLYMIIKLTLTFFKLSVKQLFSDKTYEYCFRVIAGAQSLKKND